MFRSMTNLGTEKPGPGARGQGSGNGAALARGLLADFGGLQGYGVLSSIAVSQPPEAAVEVAAVLDTAQWTTPLANFDGRVKGIPRVEAAGSWRFVFGRLTKRNQLFSLDRWLSGLGCE